MSGIVTPDLSSPLTRLGEGAAPSDACDPPFYRVVVSRLIHGGTTVMWEPAPWLQAASPVTYTLEAGYTDNQGADDWAAAAGPRADAFFAVDREQRVYGTTDWGFYRVHASCALGEFLSDPVSSMGTLDFRDWNLAREVLRKERLRSRLADQDGFLLKRRVTGVKCRRCADYQTGSPRDPDCPDCYGTGWECGYFYPMPDVWASLDPRASHIQLDGGAGRGTVNDTAVRARMLAVPVLTELDVWVARRTDSRYFVHEVQNVSEWRGAPLSADVMLRPVPFTHRVYEIQIPGQSEEPRGWRRP